MTPRGRPEAAFGGFTRDGDNPLRHGRAPLYAVDVWAHSLDVHDERERYPAMVT